MQYAQNNPDAMQDLNIKIQRMSVSKMPIGTTTSIGGTKPSSNPNYAGGSSWTGD